MLNKVILIGRLGRDPECRYLPNGEAVCNFSVATSENWTMYRKLAEIAAQYLKKGSQVYIEGRIQSRKYTGKDGIERTAYEIVCSEMKMLGGKAEGSSESTNTAAPHDPPRHQAPAAPAQPVDDTDGIPF